MHGAGVSPRRAKKYPSTLSSEPIWHALQRVLNAFIARTRAGEGPIPTPCRRTRRGTRTKALHGAVPAFLKRNGAWLKGEKGLLYLYSVLLKLYSVLFEEQE